MRLAEKQCIPLQQGQSTLDDPSIESLMGMLDSHWELLMQQSLIQRHFQFRDFYQTMAFVNAVAWIAQQQDHHPDMQLGYNHCSLQFTSHIAHGLTENDFICAAKVDQLLIN